MPSLAAQQQQAVRQLKLAHWHTQPAPVPVPTFLSFLTTLSFILVTAAAGAAAPPPPDPPVAAGPPNPPRLVCNRSPFSACRQQGNAG